MCHCLMCVVSQSLIFLLYFFNHSVKKLLTLQRIEGQACLLGEARVIERRKVDTCCLNGAKYERKISATPCNCTKEDFEW